MVTVDKLINWNLDAARVLTKLTDNAVTMIVMSIRSLLTVLMSIGSLDHTAATTVVVEAFLVSMGIVVVVAMCASLLSIILLSVRSLLNVQIHQIDNR